MSGLTLVTGASGFIGRRLVRDLVDRGAAVRILVRRPEALEARLRACVDVVQGDVRDPAALAAAVRGAKMVLHLAACARAWSPDPREFEAVNVRAVVHLLEAARRHGVERLVHVSTALTLPPAGGAPRPLTAYEASKLEGERRMEAFAARGGNAIIVHPTRVYGPGPLNDANGVTRLIDLYLRGRFRLRLADRNVTANYVHVADVAYGIRLAAERGRSGAHYVLGGDTNLSLAAFLDLVGSLAAIRRRVVAIPPAVALAGTALVRTLGPLRSRVSLTPEWIRVFLEHRPADISAARDELAYAPRPLPEGLRETIEWLGEGRAAGVPTASDRRTAHGSDP